MTALDQRGAVVAEARRWLGTPYHPHGRLIGVGVDCAMLLAEVFERCGLVGHIDAGDYAPQWHLHRSEEIFLGWLAQAGAHEVQTPAPGDIGLWHFGRTWSHGGIVVSPALDIVHAYVGLGVVSTRPHEAPLAGRPVRWYSIWG